MRKEQVAIALLAVAAAKPLWSLIRKLKLAWELDHLPVIILRGGNGMEVHVSPLGCIIQRLLVPNAQGELEDVVLGFDELKPYSVSSLACQLIPPSLDSVFNPRASHSQGVREPCFFPRGCTLSMRSTPGLAVS